MKQSIFLSLIIVFSGLMVVIENLPLKDCHNKNVDLLLVAQFHHRPNQTLNKIKNIVKYFLEYGKKPDRSVTVSVLHSVTWQLLLNFTDIRSMEAAGEHLNKLITSKDDTPDYHNRLNFTNIVHLFTFIIRNKTSEESTKLIVWLTRCTDYECDFNFGTTKDKINKALEEINLMVINSGDNEKINAIFSGELYESNIVNVGENDLLDDVNILSVKLCGHCAKNWTYRQSVKYPRQRSCYKLIHQKFLMTWDQINDYCLRLDSSLINIETNEEFDFIKNIFEMKSPWMFMEEITLYIGLQFKITGQYKRLEWSNRRPMVLKSDIIRNIYSDQDDKSCWSLVYYRNTTFNISSFNLTLNIRSEKLQCQIPFANTYACEKNVPITFLEKSYNNLKNSPLTSVNINRFYLFNCVEGRGYVHYYQVCDGQIHCKGGRDEEYCYIETSARRRLSRKQQSFFECSVHSSTFNDYIFTKLLKDVDYDGVHNCYTSHDEETCKKCADTTCFLKSCNALPVFKHVRNLQQATCLKNFGSCRFTLCDGRKTLVSDTSQYHNVGTAAPNCVYFRLLVGSPAGCPGMTNLQECETFSCPQGFVKCPFSYCVPLDYVNDNIKDCPYGEDEEMAINFNDRLLQQCYVTTNGIRHIHYCNGVVDCDNYADELNCQNCLKEAVCKAGVAVVNSNKFSVASATVQNPLKVLYLSGLDISYFNYLYFDDMFELYMFKCGIDNDTILLRFVNPFREIIPGSLTNKNLFKIDMSYNLLKLITRNGFFSLLSNLQFLNLEHNLHLELIEKDSFLSKKLRVLNLSYTRIASLPYYLLKYSLLEEIILHNTRITSLDWLPCGIILKSLDLRNTTIKTNVIYSLNVLNNLVITQALYTDHFQLCCPHFTGRGIPQHLCHSPTDAISSCDDLLADTTQRLLMWVVAVVSVVGNLTVVLYRCINSGVLFSRAFGVFVFNLGIADFIMGVYLLIIASVDVYYRNVYVLYESKWRHSYLCKTAGFLSTLSSETSNFFVLIITMDRYLAMRFPFGEFSFTKISHLLVVLLTWSLTFFLALLPLLKSEWVIYSSNGMCFGLPLTNRREVGWEYSFSVFICLNFLLFLVIAVGQIAIYRSMSVNCAVQSSNQMSQRRTQDIEIAQQLILVATSNLLCWLPVCIICLMSIAGRSVGPKVYAWILVFVLPLNSALNPMIYTIPFIYKKLVAFMSHFMKRNMRTARK